MMLKYFYVYISYFILYWDFFFVTSKFLQLFQNIFLKDDNFHAISSRSQFDVFLVQFLRVILLK